jgi:hypothetical protein
MFNFSKKLILFSAWKEFFISSSVILFCLFLFSFFPAQDFFQKIFREVFFFLFVPVLYIKFVLKKDLADFGNNFSFQKTGLLWTGSSVFCLALFLGLLIKFTSFSENYFLSQTLRENFWAFLFYELLAFNFFFFLQEFFFKGFVLFTLAEKFKGWSISIVFSLYALILLLENDFSWQMTPLILYMFGGSVIAYKNKSFWLSYLVGLIFIILLDSFLIYIAK